MASAYANAALEVTSKFTLDTLSERLECVCRSPRNSEYGNEPDTAQFGVVLLKAQQPELFSKEQKKLLADTAQGTNGLMSTFP